MTLLQQEATDQPPKPPQRFTYSGFVKMIADFARDEAVARVGIEPDEEEFRQMKSSWNAICIPPEHHGLAQKLLIKKESDPKDLMHGVAEHFNGVGLVLPNLFFAPGDLNPDGVRRAFAIALVRMLVQYFANLVGDLKKMAEFVGTLEKVGVPRANGTTYYRVAPEQKAAIRAALGASFIDVDAFFKEIEDPVTPGQNI